MCLGVSPYHAVYAECLLIKRDYREKDKGLRYEGWAAEWISGFILPLYGVVSNVLRHKKF